VTVCDAFVHKSERERGLPRRLHPDRPHRARDCCLSQGEGVSKTPGLLRGDPKVYLGTNVKLLHPARREIGRGRLLETERQFVPFLQTASESVKDQY